MVKPEQDRLFKGLLKYLRFVTVEVDRVGEEILKCLELSGV
jgi:hypothetical protein